MDAAAQGRSRVREILLSPLVAFVLAVVLVSPFFLAHRTRYPLGPGWIKSVPTTHDMAAHVSVLLEFDKAVRAGSFYPRWQAGFNGGYGLPLLNYYSPGFYFAAEVAFLALRDYIDAFFFVSVWCMAASGLAMYGLLRMFYGRWSSGLAALFYMVTPYHLLDLYQRGAFPEFAGFVMAPLIFWAACATGKYGRPRDYAALGCAYGLFVFTHWPVAYLLTYALVIYVLLWTVTERDWRIATRVTGGVGLGALLSAIYWVPVLLEAGLVQQKWTGMFPYGNSYLPDFHPRDEMGVLLNLSFGAQAAALLAAIVIAAMTRKRSGRAWLWIIPGLMVVFMLTPLSSPVSRLIPRIDVVTFAWRWLVIGAFFAAAALGAALDLLWERSDQSPALRWAGLSLMAVVLVGNGWISVQSLMLNTLKKQDMHVPLNHSDLFFYPAQAVSPSQLQITPPATIVAGRGSVRVERWEPFDRRVDADLQEDGTLRLKSYNFAGWIAHVDGQPATLQSDMQGIQILALPAGRHVVEVRFVNTLPRTAGTMITGLALWIACGLLLWDLSPRLRRRV